MKILFSDAINNSPENIYPWIENPDKARKWQKGVKGGHVIKKTENIIGTTFTETIEEKGRKLEMKGVITKYVKNKIMGFHIESKIHSFDISYSLDKGDDSTKITIDADIKWKFPINIVILFSGKKISKNLENELRSEINELKMML